VKSLASLYAGALCQFTMGRMGWSSLCIFINPLMVGADGFRLMYFHLESCGISVLLLLIVFLIRFWYVLVGSMDVVWKLFVCRKSCILDLYC
jgi:hypothetical protein